MPVNACPSCPPLFSIAPPSSSRTGLRQAQRVEEVNARLGPRKRHAGRQQRDNSRERARLAVGKKLGCGGGGGGGGGAASHTHYSPISIFSLSCAPKEREVRDQTINQSNRSSVAVSSKNTATNRSAPAHPPAVLGNTVTASRRSGGPAVPPVRLSLFLFLSTRPNPSNLIPSTPITAGLCQACRFNSEPTSAPGNNCSQGAVQCSASPRFSLLVSCRRRRK
ncbi:hypothetical protein IWX49DRAFT_171342 [Phyllosticta citricarpa]|uniref:Uncharacterized protein n=1 Tax=Phyllosticta citricarpa TaxID=55181 RepID=A0ABR1M5U4_9PEZI